MLIGDKYKIPIRIMNTKPEAIDLHLRIYEIAANSSNQDTTIYQKFEQLSVQGNSFGKTSYFLDTSDLGNYQRVDLKVEIVDFEENPIDSMKQGTYLIVNGFPVYQNAAG